MTDAPKRRLSFRAAQRCESACTPRCRCRCGGALHGAKRFGKDAPEREQLATLPEDDPHRVPTLEEYKRLKLAEAKKRRAARRQPSRQLGLGL